MKTELPLAAFLKIPLQGFADGAKCHFVPGNFRLTEKPDIQAFNAGLEINVEASMDPVTAAGLQARGHRVEVIDDSYQDFGAGQFIWRLGDPAAEGYVAASDPRRDGQAVAF